MISPPCGVVFIWYCEGVLARGGEVRDLEGAGCIANARLILKLFVRHRQRYLQVLGIDDDEDTVAY